MPSSTLECVPGGAYGQDAFLYFLEMERARAERVNRGLRLLLVTLEQVPGQPEPIAAPHAARLFDGLRRSLRETDVMGWYRQGRVAGAVLADVAADPETAAAVGRRVGDGLRKQLPARAARSLRIRVVQLRPRGTAGG